MTSWQSGQAVRISNLPNSHLNGQVGTVVGQDTESGKWVVRLEKDSQEAGIVGWHSFIDL